MPRLSRRSGTELGRGFLPRCPSWGAWGSRSILRAGGARANQMVPEEQPQRDLQGGTVRWSPKLEGWALKHLRHAGHAFWAPRAEARAAGTGGAPPRSRGLRRPPRAPLQPREASWALPPAGQVGPGAAAGPPPFLKGSRRERPVEGRTASVLGIRTPSVLNCFVTLDRAHSLTPTLSLRIDQVEGSVTNIPMQIDAFLFTIKYSWNSSS